MNEINLDDYEIIEASDDVTATRFEKRNITADFTLAEMMAEQDQLRSYITQFEGQERLEAAKMDNIETHHKFVKKLTGKQLTAAKIYHDAKEVKEKIDGKLPELRQQLEDSEKEMALLMGKFGLTLPTKDEVVENAVSKIIEDGAGPD